MRVVLLIPGNSCLVFTTCIAKHVYSMNRLDLYIFLYTFKCSIQRFFVIFFRLTYMKYAAIDTLSFV